MLESAFIIIQSIGMFGIWAVFINRIKKKQGRKYSLLLDKYQLIFILIFLFQVLVCLYLTLSKGSFMSALINIIAIIYCLKWAREALYNNE